MWITVGDTTYNTDALAYVRRAQREGRVSIVVCPTNSPARQFTEDEAQELLDFLSVETAIAHERNAYEIKHAEKNDIELCKLINDFQDTWEARG